MSAPPAVTWASGGAITTPSADKIALGFVPGERPPAQFLNYVLNLLALWVTYLATLPVAQMWRWFPPRLTSDLAPWGASGTVSEDGTHAYVHVTTSSAISTPIVVQVGQTITDFGWTGSLTDTAIATLYHNSSTGAATSVATFTINGVNAISASVGGAGTEWTTGSGALMTPHTVVDACAYWITIQCSGTGATLNVAAVGVKSGT